MMMEMRQVLEKALSEAKTSKGKEFLLSWQKHQTEEDAAAEPGESMGASTGVEHPTEVYPCTVESVRNTLRGLPRTDANADISDAGCQETEDSISKCPDKEDLDLPYWFSAGKRCKNKK